MAKSRSFRSMCAPVIQRAGGVHAAIAFVSLAAALTLAEVATYGSDRRTMLPSAPETMHPARVKVHTMHSRIMGLIDSCDYASACRVIAGEP